MQNAFVCYMKLYHFKEAKKCAHYIKYLKEDYPLGFLFIGQSTYYNRDATLEEIKYTKKIIEEGLYILHNTEHNYSRRDI